ncbi:hypothetical protein ACFLXF_05045 [Chloroflexota bacterium]
MFEKPDYQGQDSFSVTALSKELGVHRATAYRRAANACDLGYLINTETRPGRPLQLKLGEPLPEKKAALPDPESLLKENGDDVPK